ncbi:MAG: MarR family transcriptional regulator, partial [Alteraurantiacibacter sp.]
ADLNGASENALFLASEMYREAERCQANALDMRSKPTEISVMTERTIESGALPPAVEKFVLNWGDLGGQWGVNRSVAQIQALLLLSERPLHAEEIAEKLGLARSNVSNSIKELINWKLVRRVPLLGDRRDHFEAETDMWQMASKVAQGRKEREIDPMVTAIHSAMSEIDDPRISPVVRKRMVEMNEFITTVDSWYEQMIRVPPAQIMTLIRMGAKVVGLLKFVGRRGPKAGATTENT